jgi:hypothetical protein
MDKFNRLQDKEGKRGLKLSPEDQKFLADTREWNAMRNAELEAKRGLAVNEQTLKEMQNAATIAQAELALEMGNLSKAIQAAIKGGP